MSDLISRQMAIDGAYEVIRRDNSGNNDVVKAMTAWVEYIRSLPSAYPEKLTDAEQRIFLAAMKREEDVCKQVDEECKYYRLPHEDSLVVICRKITRKVKNALWT